MDKNYDKKMERLRAAFNDVKKNRLNAKSEHVQQILDLGLWEAKDRVNVNEHVKEMQRGEEANYLTL